MRLVRRHSLPFQVGLPAVREAAVCRGRASIDRGASHVRPARFRAAPPASGEYPPSRRRPPPHRRGPLRFAGSAGGRERAAASRSEEHTSELQSLMRTSYAVFCLQQKTYNPSTATLLTTNTV